MAAKLTPGAVVVVGRGDQTIYEKAFGFRATVPAEEPMTLDTVFDLASLTKVVGDDDGGDDADRGGTRPAQRHRSRATSRDSSATEKAASRSATC